WLAIRFGRIAIHRGSARISPWSHDAAPLRILDLRLPRPVPARVATGANSASNSFVTIQFMAHSPRRARFRTACSRRCPHAGTWFLEFNSIFPLKTQFAPEEGSQTLSLARCVPLCPTLCILKRLDRHLDRAASDFVTPCALHESVDQEHWG